MSLQREHKGKRVVLYPAYFDARLSRSKGRRVPTSVAVKGVRAEDIARAAEELGFEAYVEPGAYPRAWWLDDKRVVVEKAGKSKTEIIRLIAARLADKHRSKRR
ncbi:MAG: signal recognition particle protein Srp19 [Desulfurococcales archaeon]|nr:signal recognition particle protein Srp19 [Desulfurococcales archaeon]